jgi:diguanylate cyclase (GGDEF)-like protein
MGASQYLGILYTVAALAAATTTVLALRRRGHTPAAAALALAMAGPAWWAATEAIGLLFLSTEHRLELNLWIYPGVGATVIGFYWLCRTMVDRNWRMEPKTRWLLLAEPTVMSVLAITDRWHGLVNQTSESAGSVVLVAGHFGPVFWVHSTYSYLLLGWALVGVARAWVDAPALQRRQLGSLLLGAAFPAVTNAVSLALVANGNSLDVSPIGFVITGIIASYAVFRLGLMRLVPVARGLVVDTIGDGLVVLDRDGRILDLNPAAESLLRRVQGWYGVALPDDLVGHPGSILRPPDQAPGPLRPGEFHLRVGDEQLDLDLRLDPLHDRRGAVLGLVVLMRDITEVQQRRRELAAANDRLQKQLVTIEALRQDLTEQAVRDELTGLHNRRYLLSALEADLARAVAGGNQLSVLLLDLDHFKAVNDAYGHAVGDELLRAVADALQAGTRSGDTLARYGGEEFVVVLPDTSAAAACDRADAIRHRIAAASVPAGDARVSVTLSAGIATYPTCGTAPKDLLQAADEALYQAKALGRDRAVHASTAATELAAVSMSGTVRRSH